MSKFVDKIAGALGFSSEYDEYDEYEDEDYVEEEVPKKTVNYETNRTRYEEDRKEYDNIRPYRQKNSKVVNLHANVQMEVVVTSRKPSMKPRRYRNISRIISRWSSIWSLSNSRLPSGSPIFSVAVATLSTEIFSGLRTRFL